MEAKDLRIGNLVQYSNDERIFVNLIGKTLEVTAADILSIYNDNIPVEPILLTEKWLIKLDFLKVACHYENDCFDIYNYKQWFVVELIENEKSFELGLKCKYVHQLQNLYFAITGEELIIKK